MDVIPITCTLLHSFGLIPITSCDPDQLKFSSVVLIVTRFCFLEATTLGFVMIGSKQQRDNLFPMEI
jgi:hypothetical protein